MSSGLEPIGGLQMIDGGALGRGLPTPILRKTPYCGIKLIKTFKFMKVHPRTDISLSQAIENSLFSSDLSSNTSLSGMIRVTTLVAFLGPGITKTTPSLPIPSTS